jgi:membrane protease YdiL (CAAX protease family)
VHTAAAIVATAFVVLLVVVVPLSGPVRHARFIERFKTDGASARLSRYRRGVLGEWLLVAVVLAVGLLSGRCPGSIGVWRAVNGAALVTLVVGLALIGLVTVPLIRASSERMVEYLSRHAPSILPLLPVTRLDRAWFAALAVSAGFCEEVTYRGFGIAYVRWCWPGAGTLQICVLTGVAFGLAHVYQGTRGFVGSTLIGVVLAASVIATHTLTVVILLHAAFDLRLLLLRRADIEAALEAWLAMPEVHESGAGASPV